MRITCPSCAAEYEVPASRLSSHRMVRCVRCGGEWMAQETDAREANSREADAPEADAPDPSVVPAGILASQAAEWDTPAMTAMDRLAATAPLPRRSIGLTAAWMATLVVLIGAIAATIVWREAAVRAWPPIGRILGTAGGFEKAITPPNAEPPAQLRNEPAEKP
jgi:predicted Zn finger-like uncharacterized protein